ncbi:MAG: DUF2079 domain-containing protein, partial [Proteobacteria bacterium]|nr:DUF2079 domain-containing protein [Pseudomonadota bacterium]
TIGMCLYLLFAGNQTVAYYDFHPYAISLGTIPWMVLFALQRRYTPLILCVLLHLSLKEHTGLFVAFFGAWLVLTHRTLVGWLLAGLGAATFVAVMIWAFPYFRHGQPSEYLGKYYGYLGNSWSEWIQTVTMTPQVLFAEVFQINKLGYLIKIFAPFAFIHLIRPVSLVEIFTMKPKYIHGCLSRPSCLPPIQYS